MNTAHELDAIVAGVDGSQAALQAVRWAAVEARNYSCPLRLGHTLQWPLVGYPIPPGLRADWTNEIHEQGCAWLWQAEKATNLIAPEVRVEVHLLAGDPHPAKAVLQTDPAPGRPRSRTAARRGRRPHGQPVETPPCRPRPPGQRADGPGDRRRRRRTQQLA